MKVLIIILLTIWTLYSYFRQLLGRFSRGTFQGRESWTPSSSNRKVTKSIKKSNRKILSSQQTEAIHRIKEARKFISSLLMRNDLKDILKRITLSHCAALRKIDMQISIDRIKEDFNIVKKLFLTLEEIGVDQTKHWRKTSTSGFPPYLNNIYRSLERLEDTDKILLLTYLRTYKYLDLPGPHKFSTIIDPQGFTNSIWTLWVSWEIISTYKDLSVGFASKTCRKIKPTILDHSTIFTPGIHTGSIYSRSGPNGNSTLARLVDLINVVSNKTHFILLECFCRIWGNWLFSNKVPTITFGIKTPYALCRWFEWKQIKTAKRNFILATNHIPSLQRSIRLGILAKMSYFIDGAGKWRYIAIGNWVLQGTLYPLHCLIIKHLKSHLWDSDATYNQGKIYLRFTEIRDQYGKILAREYGLPCPLPPDFSFTDWVEEKRRDDPNFSDNLKPFPQVPYSLDLSAATDRLPLVVQASVLLRFTGSIPLAITWLLIIGLTTLFVVKPVSLKLCRINYTVGQGMGFYSSWAILALTHHVLVRLSALRVGLRGFDEYLVLGDDIVIFHHDVAMEYKKVIDSLGVEISTPKSIEPFELFGAEFASQLVHENEQGLITNLSPLPIGTIFEGGKTSLFQLWDSIWSRVDCSLFEREGTVQHEPRFPMFPCALNCLRTQENPLLHVWAIRYLYLNWYKKEWSNNGCSTEIPEGYPLRVPLKYMLENTSYPLALFHKIDNSIKEVFLNRVLKSSRAVCRYAFDDEPLKVSTLKLLPANWREVRSHLMAWPELWLFFNSPWLSVQTEAEDFLEQLSTRSDCGLQMDDSSGNSRLFTNVFNLKWLTTINQDSDYLPSEELIKLERFVLLSWGPAAIFMKRTVKSRDKRNTRISKGKKVLVWKDRLILQSINANLRNNKLLK
uniref:RNA-dependent RNA polymerase n=1 Tax=Egaenus convexus mitovirus 1 TaxID=2964775 RepID=A0A9N6YJ60_9VIRU|nr:TPA_inf: RNA-dependent RNA polymerase [Egaenus convexus mitovirus 1]